MSTRDRKQYDPKVKKRAERSVDPDAWAPTPTEPNGSARALNTTSEELASEFPADAVTVQRRYEELGLEVRQLLESGITEPLEPWDDRVVADVLEVDGPIDDLLAYILRTFPKCPINDAVEMFQELLRKPGAKWQFMGEERRVYTTRSRRIRARPVRWYGIRAAQD